MSLNATLIKSTVVAALGGLLFGFDTAVISGTTGSLTEAYQLSPFLLGVTVFSALLGTVLGAMLAGFPGERFGRRDSLRVMAILYLISHSTKDCESRPFVAHSFRRIIKAPVNALCLSRNHGAMLARVIADRYHVIKLLPCELVHRLRTMS